MEHTAYTADFYQNIHDGSRLAASTILDLVLSQIPQVGSAVDIGCGTGAWLHGIANKLVEVDLIGIDGPWVPQIYREIPQGSFIEFEFGQNTNFPQIPKKDLAICLEVAEHLYPEHAPGFVQYLASLSDFIIFSAAIPQQGGDDHFNEQWPSYWANLFQAHGMVLIDCIRHDIWDNPDVPLWYRQNVFLVAHQSRLDELKNIMPHSINSHHAYVHPELWEYRIIYLQHKIDKLQKQSALKILRRNIKQMFTSKTR